MPRERVITGESHGEEENRFNYSLRPQRFENYIGQPTLIRRLKIAVDAATGRKEPVEHVLLHGPPGLGKTTLAHVIANEVGAQVHVTSGPALTKGADLVGILQKLAQGDVLFIDEIHRLPVIVEEFLYSAMEDFKVDVTIDAGMHARTITLPIPPFTLIGATTRIGLLTGPMRSRFGIVNHIEFYSHEALHQILIANAGLLKLVAEDQALWEVARRSRGTPRIANRLLRRVRDFAYTAGDERIDVATADRALTRLEIDGLGLDAMDRRYLLMIADLYGGGPVGVETLAAGLSEPRDTIEDVIEPYLIQLGLVARTARGRCLNGRAWTHLGLNPPAGAQTGLFDGNGVA